MAVVSYAAQCIVDSSGNPHSTLRTNFNCVWVVRGLNNMHTSGLKWRGCQDPAQTKTVEMGQISRCT